MNRSFVTAAITCTLFFGGCKVGPNYQPPVTELMEAWPEDAAIFSTEPALINWWDRFEDPDLSRYISLSAVYNHDVRQAVLNIYQARLSRRIIASTLYPSINSNAAYTHVSIGKNGVQSIFGNFANQGGVPGVPSNTTSIPFPVSPIPTLLDIQRGSSFAAPIPSPTPSSPFTTGIDEDIYSLGLDFTWELDLFGQIRRQTEAACARIGESTEQTHQLLVSLFGEVANTYLEILAIQERILLTQRKLELLEEKNDLLNDRLVLGISSELELENLAADIEEARSNLPPLYAELYSRIYQLAFLTGHPSEQVILELLNDKQLPSLPEAVPIGIPADLLRRRADIRAAERDLAATTADIGVAVADLYPKISLNTILNLQSPLIGTLFTGDSHFTSNQVPLTLPIYQGGRIKANILLQQVKNEASYVRYEQVVAKAMEEVKSSLIKYENEASKEASLQAVYRSRSKSLALRQNRYDQGIDDQMTLIDAKRLQIAAEDQLVIQQQATLKCLVSLYKALGGGWENFCL